MKQIPKTFCTFGIFSYNPENPEWFEDDQDYDLGLNFSHWQGFVFWSLFLLSVVLILIFASI